MSEFAGNETDSRHKLVSAQGRFSTLEHHHDPDLLCSALAQPRTSQTTTVLRAIPVALPSTSNSRSTSQNHENQTRTTDDPSPPLSLLPSLSSPPNHQHGGWGHAKKILAVMYMTLNSERFWNVRWCTTVFHCCLHKALPCSKSRDGSERSETSVMWCAS